MDTETTGLYGECGDELLELALVDDAGNVLLDFLVKPDCHTEWPEAQAIHGITPPTWPRPAWKAYCRACWT